MTRKFSLVMQYYINICRLGKDESECKEPNCCRQTFWKKNIPITEPFYRDLLLYKNVMIILEIHQNGNLIPNIERYFQKDVEFTLRDIKETDTSKVLICELNAYFTSDDEPF